jgi:hypothetical protein
MLAIFFLTRDPHFPRPPFSSMNSTPAEFEWLSAPFRAAEAIGFVSQKGPPLALIASALAASEGAGQVHHRSRR